MYGDLVEWRKEGGCKAMLENEPTQNQKQIPIHDGNKDSLKWHLKSCDFTIFFFPSRSISCFNVLSIALWIDRILTFFVVSSNSTALEYVHFTLQ